MASRHRIINAAVVLNGSPPLPNEDGTDEQYNVGKFFFDDEVKDVFEQYRWKWASITEPLIRDITFTRGDFPGRVLYKKPNDAVSIIDVWSGDSYDQSVRYFPDKRGIWAPDIKNLFVQYVQMTPPEEFPIWFQKIVESKLAIRIAEKEGSDRIGALSELYKIRSAEAQKNDNREAGQIRSFGTADRYTRVRNSYAGSVTLGDVDRGSLEYQSGRS